MTMLLQEHSNKNILLIISGGIAAYKMPEFVRRIKEQGANVKVVMTSGAKAFITPLTLQAVSGESVAEDLLDPQAEASMGHIEFAKWADLVVVAPATADIIAKMAAGLANDLATTLLLATPAPVIVCPAMNQQMFAHPATQDNLKLLTQRGVTLCGPASGEQACGDVGLGRMVEPAEIVATCVQHFDNLLDTALPIWQGKTITITAGPTREGIDPVRYISNHSSGKMGFAIAQAAAQLGAKVNLISGPVNLTTPNNVSRTDVVSACDMHLASLNLATQSDVFIACAAVADYRPDNLATQKIKKDNDVMQITMTKNPDIVKDVAALTENRPFVVGFAAETQDVEQYAKSKMLRKNLDMICANDVSVSGQGFNSDQNALKVYWDDGSKDLPLENKSVLAKHLLSLIHQTYNR
ncbi:bifunctional phosphopantothenoylcysteine decarboxylase/phosphopantothenate--cysteine ligase CoaBC [Psychrosphaera aquimarina]|uniref:Coenzyme A biosynthesis bifunctional protein CoaBC n=1 Tax=Psychrosphaera aquimarina TaxID=2044854 RepID=A0ABU3R1S3_9GAMM|nr:bifunctional phosphopantothenoylcysteine decarboxylase/phosphopantothenate--cysteine ligase CoaBC [Psychrosphaera aquimarina]MDU0113628.1 bifunctional phosphopantothenoylcysteine decarboxylase/phosphopantothenate--cysteine ligase CoaBC [Psychrosphaera aquimarina]